MSKPIDKELYDYVKKLANKKFKSKTGIYKSSWIVREYKRRGGKYKGKKSDKQGILRWYNEKWIDLNRPIKNKSGKIIGYEKCGRSNIKKEKYPLCRPTYKISKFTPRTYTMISKKSILKAKKLKAKVKGNKNIQFGSGKEECKICKSFSNMGECNKHKSHELDIKCEFCDEHNLKGGGEITERKKYSEKKINYLLNKYKNVLLKHEEKLKNENNKDNIIVLTNKIKMLNKAINKLQRKLVNEKESSKEKKKKIYKFEDNGKNKYKINDEIKDIIKQKYGGAPQYYGKRSSKMIKVPSNVKKWAQYAFKLKKLGFEGAIETGWKRAYQLSTKEKIPIEDLRYMRNWYARHIYTSYPTFKEWIKAGRPKTKEWHNKRGIQAWITWGANAGFKWINSDKVIKMLNKHFDKNYKKIKIKV